MSVYPNTGQTVSGLFHFHWGCIHWAQFSFSMSKRRNPDLKYDSSVCILRHPVCCLFVSGLHSGHDIQQAQNLHPAQRAAGLSMAMSQGCNEVHTKQNRLVPWCSAISCFMLQASALQSPNAWGRGWRHTLCCRICCCWWSGREKRIWGGSRGGHW